jgi:sarcosine oxidase subunit gamma
MNVGSESAPTLSRAPDPPPSPVERGRVGVGAARLNDAFHLRRFGLKGPRAAEWLRELGIEVPAIPNSWRSINDSPIDLIARLGSFEFFIEQAAPAALIDRIANALGSPLEGVYPALREDRAFVLSGNGAEEVLAQVCNIDFKNTARTSRPVFMTMMIGVAVLVIPQDGKWGQSPIPAEQETGTVPEGSAAHEANAGYRIWCDPSYGDHLWSSLQDVMQGRNVGEAE